MRASAFGVRGSEASFQSSTGESGESSLKAFFRSLLNLGGQESQRYALDVGRKSTKRPDLGVVPYAAFIEGPRGFHGCEGGMSPEKVLLPARSKQPQHAATVGQHEYVAPIRACIELGELTNTVEDID